ncbi:MAG: InlB B-repeat-containing protein, partial [Candidatus Methanomethylophilaceae archaeon]|nr:InlB B-repeat-containing protein [Candidatus Methanomethylophilaceae archaeon]
MDRFKTTLFALFAVALMALTPLAVIGEGFSAVEGSISEPESYLYTITTDLDNVQITSVEASTGGSALSQISGTRTAKEDIPDYWSFDRETGVGPFNSFYAAINIDGGYYADNGEVKRNHKVGTIAFVLDPYDLKKSINGTDLTGYYNIMLIVPTVYWKSVGTTLYLSSSPSYTAGSTTVEGMTAYAHTATSGDVSKVYPYIGIGVYEASVNGSSKMVSVRGVTPKASSTCDEFKGYADNLASAANSDYQQWNFYQWTLYKMMAYTVMGTKNSQAMIDNGQVFNSSSSPTGRGDTAGPYGANSLYSKLFLENTWGSLAEFVGDTAFFDRELYARNDLGGTRLLDDQGDANFGSQSSTGILFPSSSGRIGAAYSVSAYWDLPKAIGGDSSSFSFPGDYAWPDSGWRSLSVGGWWYTGTSAGLACADGDDSISIASNAIGARLAYVMDADAAAIGTCYISNGGTGGEVSRPQAATVEDCMFGAPWGHAFAGWNTKADGTGVWYFPGDGIDYNGHMVILYAQWEGITGRIPDPVDYMYAVSTDANNVSVEGVRASVAGSSLVDVYSGTNTTKGSIASFWDFDRSTGMGPFNSFYAAINLYDGEGPEADGGEFKFNSAAGAIAFVLDPYDLSKTLMGTEFDKSRYNVMLVIPTVYLKSEDNVLYLSSSSSYAAGPTTVEGMTAYAHTATSGDVSKVYPYIGIG